MGFHVRNEEAHRLATEVAGLTGETLDEAVTTALRERLERIRQEREKGEGELEKQKRLQDLKAIAHRFASQLKEPLPDHGEFLYDERGLPK